ncbi:hypothetical protein HK405_011304, partial [Cladochytrium tenue]
ADAASMAAVTAVAAERTRFRRAADDCSARGLYQGARFATDQLLHLQPPPPPSPPPAATTSSTGGDSDGSSAAPVALLPARFAWDHGMRERDRDVHRAALALFQCRDYAAAARAVPDGDHGGGALPLHPTLAFLKGYSQFL